MFRMLSTAIGSVGAINAPNSNAQPYDRSKPMRSVASQKRLPMMNVDRATPAVAMMPTGSFCRRSRSMST
jgi:hypothetical protein